MDDYTAEKIQILEGLEGVRKRPAMYIGDIGKRGLHHLVYEIVDNAVDEAMAGYCKNIWVSIHNDNSVTVKDDGRGIPTEIHPKAGKPTLEVISLTLHAGGKFEKSAYKVSGGLHGVGLSVVNALSERMEIESHRNGKAWHMSSERGKLKTHAKEVGDTHFRGTVIRFKPDATIFQVTEYDYGYLKERMMELAFLNPQITIYMEDERGEQKKEQFHFDGGINEFVGHINKSKRGLHPCVHGKKSVDNVEFEFAFQYTDTYRPTIYSFVNDIHTVEGGTHEVGFRSALTRALNEYIRTNKVMKDAEEKITGDDALEGLTAVLSAKVPEPQFEGQTKTKLGNSEVKGIVDSIVYDAIKTQFEENPHIARTAIEKVMNAMKAREAAQKAKDLIRRKSVFESSILPGKLADCSETDAAKCELYFVEGDSAGGSAKQARDRTTQAILPLRGKILNVEKAQLARILTSEEIKSIILALGAGFGDEFNIGKARYHKIVIMTDADVDGAHIRTLLLTLFYRHLKPMIDTGYLYIAQPPLYKIWRGKEVAYAYNDDEKDRLVERMGGNPSIQRYKGLGEMNPEQLWETTMDPEKRTLKRVTIEDAVRADELFSILMGDEVEPRREFIEKHAAQVANLDI
ncbi:MAG: DNA topoisomerase (ATP-hydrolyzing) subunit B [Candidatus Bilamarchaeaceae archaeon]